MTKMTKQGVPPPPLKKNKNATNSKLGFYRNISSIQWKLVFQTYFGISMLNTLLKKILSVYVKRNVKKGQGHVIKRKLMNFFLLLYIYLERHLQ